jgi:hypothetical protein
MQNYNILPKPVSAPLDWLLLRTRSSGTMPSQIIDIQSSSFFPMIYASIDKRMNLNPTKRKHESTQHAVICKCYQVMQHLGK